jgi:predicted dehydrogenase
MKLNIACIGSERSNYQRFSEMIRDNERCNLAGVWDRESERAIGWAYRVGSIALDSYESILSDPGVDGVIITDAVLNHEELIIAAARAGKHICVEQPLAVSGIAALHIMDAVKRSGVHFTMASSVRKGAAILCKKLVDQGLLGDILNVRVRPLDDNNRLFADGKLPDFGYLLGGEKKDSGPISDSDCYGAETLRWLLGMPVSCFRMCTSIADMAKYEGIEENAVAVYKFPTGAIGVVETGRLNPQYQESLEVNCTEGSFIACGNSAKYRTKDSDWQYIPPEKFPTLGEHPIICWINNILYDRPDEEYGINEATDVATMIDAAYSSRGQEIKL